MNQGQSSLDLNTKHPGEVKCPINKPEPSNHSKNLGMKGLRGPREEKGMGKWVALGFWLGTGQASVQYSSLLLTSTFRHIHCAC